MLWVVNIFLELQILLAKKTRLKVLTSIRLRTQQLDNEKKKLFLW